MKVKKVIKKLLMLTMCASLVGTTVALPGMANTNYVFAATTSDASDFNFDPSTGTILQYVGADDLVVIPSTINGVTVTTIGTYAFDAQSVVQITIPNTVTKIDDSAFVGSESLTTVNIPSSVTSIGITDFVGCPKLQNINVDTKNNYYTSVNGALFNKSKTELVAYPVGKTATSYAVPSGVTTIRNGAFENAVFTSITFPSTLKTIEEGAFLDSMLKSFTIPTSVTSIGQDAFLDCWQLSSVTMLGNVTNIGLYAFYAESSSFKIYVKYANVKQLLINSGTDSSNIVLQA